MVKSTIRMTVVALALAGTTVPPGAQIQEMGIVPAEPREGSRLAALLSTTGATLIDDMVITPDVTSAGPDGTSGHMDRRWPTRRLPVQFAPTVTKAQQKYFFKMCRGWKKKGVKIQCVKRKGQASYIYVMNENTGCWSYVGQIGGRQELNLQGSGVGSRPGCWFDSTVRHEVAHAFGVWHEQSRTDRDTYVRIITKQIQAGKENNFRIETRSKDIGKYDFQSIMHYGSNYFAIGSKPTIVPQPGYKKFAGAKMGPQKGTPTKLDYKGVKALYKGVPVSGPEGP